MKKSENQTLEFQLGDDLTMAIVMAFHFRIKDSQDPFLLLSYVIKSDLAALSFLIAAGIGRGCSAESPKSQGTTPTGLLTFDPTFFLCFAELLNIPRIPNILQA